LLSQHSFGIFKVLSELGNLKFWCSCMKQMCGRLQFHSTQNVLECLPGIDHIRFISRLWSLKMSAVVLRGVWSVFCLICEIIFRKWSREFSSQLGWLRIEMDFSYYVRQVRKKWRILTSVRPEYYNLPLIWCSPRNFDKLMCYFMEEI
jgi:hypothetical protein